MKIPDWESLVNCTSVTLRIISPADGAEGTYTAQVRNYQQSSPSNVIFQLINLPLRLFAGLDTLTPVLEKVLPVLLERIQGSWGFTATLFTNDQEFQEVTMMQKQSEQGRQVYRWGPLEPATIDQAPVIIRKAILPLWIAFQSEYVEGCLMREQIGLNLDQMMGRHVELWARKELTPPSDSTVVSDRGLFIFYSGNALAAQKDGEMTCATEFGDLAHAICLENNALERAAIWRSQFKELVPAWETMDAERKSFVDERSLVTSEGIAQWSMFVPFKFYSEGLIKPFTADTAEVMGKAEEMILERQKIGKMSSRNPYRMGLELMESIEKSFGFPFVRFAAKISQWPLQSLSTRLPMRLLESVADDPAWGPDARLERLARLKLPEAHDQTSRLAILQAFHEALDAGLPGICNFAWNKLKPPTK